MKPAWSKHLKNQLVEWKDTQSLTEKHPANSISELSQAIDGKFGCDSLGLAANSADTAHLEGAIGERNQHVDRRENTVRGPLDYRYIARPSHWQHAHSGKSVINLFNFRVQHNKILDKMFLGEQRVRSHTNTRCLIKFSPLVGIVYPVLRLKPPKTFSQGI